MPSLRSRLAGWLLGLDPDTAQRLADTDSTSPRVLKRRQDEADERMDYLQAQIVKLRGRVVGGLRHPAPVDEYVVVEPGDEEPDPDLFEELTQTQLEVDHGGSRSAGSAEVPGVPPAL